MDNCCTAALRDKEVINVCDGCRLGYVCDLEFDLCDGRISALILPGEGAFFGFGRCSLIVIPWEKIETIGADAILVRVQPGTCAVTGGQEKEKKAKRSGLFGE